MRDFIGESYLNIVVFFVMGLSVLLIYLTTLAHFNTMLFDVGIFAQTMLQLIFTTLPLIYSTLLAGILCVEIPEFDIITCFNIFYFLYTYLFCRPRKIYRGGQLAQAGFQITRQRIPIATQLLDRSLIELVLNTPIQLSILTHIAIHYQLPMTNISRWYQFVYAIGLPRFLMGFCFIEQLTAREREKTQQPSTAVIDRYHTQSEVAFILGSFAVASTLPNHSLFDEIKSFYGKPEPIPSILLSNIGILIAIAINISRYAQSHKLYMRDQEELFQEGSSSLSSSSVSAISWKDKCLSIVAKILLNIVIAMITMLLSIIIRLDIRVRPMIIIGAININELYCLEDWNMLSRFLLALISGISISISFDAFAQQSLAYLQYSLPWYLGINLELTTLCSYFTILLVLATLLPSLIYMKSSYEKKKEQEELPNNISSINNNNNNNIDENGYQRSSSSSWKLYLANISNELFGIGFVIMAFIVTCLELILLDQVSKLC
jgi:hypothetical protein